VIIKEKAAHAGELRRVPSLKEAKRLRDEFLGRLRASGLTRDERVTYEQLRLAYIDHCAVRDRAAPLETFLDTRSKHLDSFFLECARLRSP
jgi:hypothetical protein